MFVGFMWVCGVVCRMGWLVCCAIVDVGSCLFCADALRWVLLITWCFVVLFGGCVCLDCRF